MRVVVGRTYKPKGLPGVVGVATKRMDRFVEFPRVAMAVSNGGVIGQVTYYERDLEEVVLPSEEAEPDAPVADPPGEDTPVFDWVDEL